MVIGSYLYSGDGVHGDWVKNGEETESVSEAEGILEAFCRVFLSLQQPELCGGLFTAQRSFPRQRLPFLGLFDAVLTLLCTAQST